MPVDSCSYETVVDGLRRLGVARGAVVEVHGSLKAFGRVEGGAPTVLKALMDVVSSEGTIVMSAYLVSLAVPLTDDDRAHGLTWKVRKLPVDSTEPTGMGLIADTFRARLDVVCGNDLHRTCAWGHDAEWHCCGYHGLLAVDGWCLLLGVGIDRCSSMHAGEYVPLPPEIASCWTIPPEVERAYDPEMWDIGYGGPPDDAWEKVWALADERGLIEHGLVCGAMSHYFRARSVVSIYKHWRMTDPHGLYGVPRPGKVSAAGTDR